MWKKIRHKTLLLLKSKWVSKYEKMTIVISQQLLILMKRKHQTRKRLPIPKKLNWPLLRREGQGGKKDFFRNVNNYVINKCNFMTLFLIWPKKSSLLWALISLRQRDAVRCWLRLEWYKTAMLFETVVVSNESQKHTNQENEIQRR